MEKQSQKFSSVFLRSERCVSLSHTYEPVTTDGYGREGYKEGSLSGLVRRRGREGGTRGGRVARMLRLRG